MDEQTRMTILLAVMQHLRMQQMFVLLLIYVVCERRRRLNMRNIEEQPIEELRESRKRVRDVFLNELRATPDAKSVICMRPQAFEHLCHLLKTHGGLRPTQRVCVEEQVAKFLNILSRNERHRLVSLHFRRSLMAVCRHFHRVLRAVISLEDLFLKQPTGFKVSPEILNNHQFYPYFKDCVGAIDGTHVRVRVSREQAARYRRTKLHPTQNVLAACSFDLRFTYVLAGWEGSATDSRIVKDALTREDKLYIPNGKYYLVDAAFPHARGMMGPYRETRYNLKDYSSRPPENAKELFNFRHALLRNAIDRSFGILKKRFPIIGNTTEPHYSAETQSLIVLGCCILHNFLMSYDPDEEPITQVDEEVENQEDDEENVSDEDEQSAILFRDLVASKMWNDYLVHG